jgi:Zinc carboxypeptidase
MKISKAGSGRKGYWIDATIHAREWIATATVIKILNHVSTFAHHMLVQGVLSVG